MIAEVVRSFERIRLTWNAGDARAYASEFAEDATYAIFLGDALLGRDEIEKSHIDVLTNWQKGSQMIVKVISSRRLGDNAASVLTVGGVGKDRNIKYDKMQTFTMIRCDGRWVCTAFQNTKMNRRARRAYNPKSSSGIFQRCGLGFGLRR